jgi:hypothetical protein
MVRHYGLSLGATALAAHSFLVGGFLESFFFLVALPWAWVAIAAYRGSLDNARAMSMVMMLTLAGSAVATALTAKPDFNPMPLYSLGLLPSILSWLALSGYLHYIQHQAALSPTENPGSAHDVFDDLLDDLVHELRAIKQREHMPRFNADVAWKLQQQALSFEEPEEQSWSQSARGLRSTPAYLSAA